MTTLERTLKHIMEVEKCDCWKAMRFYELSKKLTSPDFTPEVGKQVYAELARLRSGK